jgi:hypothetical protein
MTRLKLIFCAGVLGLFSFTSSANAAAITGELNITGSVQVSEDAIDWIPDGGGDGIVLTVEPGTEYFADIYNPAVVPAFYAESLDLTGQALPLANFLNDFTGDDPEYDNLSFTLTEIIVPSGTACTGTETNVGDTCVLGVFRLTNTDNGVDVAFDVNGFFVDPEFTDPNTAIGLYTAQVAGQTIASISQTLDAGGSFTNSFSATYTATAVPMPEPLTMLLLGGGLSAVAYRSRRRAAQKN